LKAPEVQLMMRPDFCCIMKGKACRMQLKCALGFTPCTLSQVSSLISQMGLNPNVPTTLMRMSMRPNASTAVWIRRRAVSKSLTSPKNGTASPPMSRMVWAVLSASPRFFEQRFAVFTTEACDQLVAHDGETR